MIAAKALIAAVFVLCLVGFLLVLVGGIKMMIEDFTNWKGETK